VPFIACYSPKFSGCGLLIPTEQLDFAGYYCFDASFQILMVIPAYFSLIALFTVIFVKVASNINRLSVLMT